jgi:hypothetical protein
MRRAYGLSQMFPPNSPWGGHAASSPFSIGDAMIMLGDIGVRGPTPAFPYVYARDADETYRALMP